MATKPASLPVWATSGGVTLEPSAGEKAAGWSAGFRPPARWFNWWMNLVYLWAVWLDAFESEAHTWTAAQDFADTFTASNDAIFAGGLLQVNNSANVDFLDSGGGTLFTCQKDAEFTNDVTIDTVGKTTKIRTLVLTNVEPTYQTPPTRYLHASFIEAFAKSYESGGLVPWPPGFGVSAGTRFATCGEPTPDSLDLLWQIRVPAGANIVGIQVLTWLSGAFNCDFGAQVASMVYASGGTYTRTQRTTLAEETISRLVAGSDVNGFKWDAIPLAATFAVPSNGSSDGFVEVRVRNLTLLTSQVFGIAALRVQYTMPELRAAI